MVDDAMIFLANVRGEVSLLAFGTKACSAGDVPKVPQGQGLTPPPRSAYTVSSRSRPLFSLDGVKNNPARNAK